MTGNFAASEDVLEGTTYHSQGMSLSGVAACQKEMSTDKTIY